MDIVPVIISGLALSISALSFYRLKRADTASRIHAAEQKRTAIRTTLLQERVASSSILQTIDRLCDSIETSKHPESAKIIATLKEKRMGVEKLVEQNQKLVEKIELLTLDKPTKMLTLADLEGIFGLAEGGLKEALRSADDIRAQEQRIQQQISKLFPNNAA